MRWGDRRGQLTLGKDWGISEGALCVSSEQGTERLQEEMRVEGKWPFSRSVQGHLRGCALEVLQENPEAGSPKRAWLAEAKNRCGRRALQVVGAGSALPKVENKKNGLGRVSLGHPVPGSIVSCDKRRVVQLCMAAVTLALASCCYRDSRCPTSSRGQLQSPKLPTRLHSPPPQHHSGLRRVAQTKECAGRRPGCNSIACAVPNGLKREFNRPKSTGCRAVDFWSIGEIERIGELLDGADNSEASAEWQGGELARCTDLS